MTESGTTPPGLTPLVLELCNATGFRHHFTVPRLALPGSRTDLWLANLAFADWGFQLNVTHHRTDSSSLPLHLGKSCTRSGFVQLAAGI